MKLLHNIYQVAGPGMSHGFDATAYLLKGKEGWFLIDCGTPEGYEQMKENISIFEEEKPLSAGTDSSDPGNPRALRPCGSGASVEGGVRLQAASS